MVCCLPCSCVQNISAGACDYVDNDRIAIVDIPLTKVALCRPRLLATAGAWFLWDFSFYGNKVFQSTFIKVLSPSGSDLEETLLWTLLNSGVALIGYWLAAAVIDNPRVGRLRLQLLGFFVVCAQLQMYLAVGIRLCYNSLRSAVLLFSSSAVATGGPVSVSLAIYSHKLSCASVVGREPIFNAQISLLLALYPELSTVSVTNDKELH